MSIAMIITAVVAVFAGLVIGVLLRKLIVEKNKAGYDEQGRKLINDALAEAEQMKKEASIQIKDEAFQLKQSTEKEIRNKRNDLIEEEKRFGHKLEQMEGKIDLIDRREQELLKKEHYFTNQEQKLAEAGQGQVQHVLLCQYPGIPWFQIWSMSQHPTPIDLKQILAASQRKVQPG